MKGSRERAWTKLHDRDGACEKGIGDGKAQRIDGPGAIAPDDHVPSLKILHGTTSAVKFNRTIIIRGKLAHRDGILNKL